MTMPNDVTVDINNHIKLIKIRYNMTNTLCLKKECCQTLAIITLPNLN